VGAATTLIVARAPAPKGSAPKQNGTLAADRTTPKGALLLMSQAMESGDANGYVESFAFSTADELKLKATLEGLVAANARFKRALSDKFGADAANRVFPTLPLVVPSDVVNSATEKIEGDSAGVTILGGKGGRPIQFTKTNDEWKMAADGFWHLNAKVMNDILGRAIKALEETGAEIPLDKFKAPIEAVDKMKERAR
jgi:hypothetical protein